MTTYTDILKNLTPGTTFSPARGQTTPGYVMDPRYYTQPLLTVDPQLWKILNDSDQPRPDFAYAVDLVTGRLVGIPNYVWVRAQGRAEAPPEDDGATLLSLDLAMDLAAEIRQNDPATARWLYEEIAAAIPTVTVRS